MRRLWRPPSARRTRVGPPASCSLPQRALAAPSRPHPAQTFTYACHTVNKNDSRNCIAAAPALSPSASQHASYHHYLHLLLQRLCHVEIAGGARAGHLQNKRLSEDGCQAARSIHLPLHVQQLGRALVVMSGKQNLGRKTLLTDLNRIDGILANNIALLIELPQFRIPEFMAHCNSLQI